MPGVGQLAVAPTPEEVVRTRPERLDRVHLLLSFGMPAVVLGSTLELLLLAGHVDDGRLRWWYALIWAVAIAGTALSHGYLRRRRHGGSTRFAQRWTPPLLIICGLMWAAPIAVLPPSADRDDIFMLQVMFLVGTSLFNVVQTGAVRLYYFCYQIPLLGVASIALLFSGREAGPILAMCGATMLLLAGGLQQVVYNTVLDSLVLSHRVEHANAQLTKANAQLATLARTDPLTGLPNRSGLGEWLGSMWSTCRLRGERLGVIVVDLDRFKVVNDSLGHEAGDELLREVARRLVEVTGSGGHVVRLGGDEFMVALPVSCTETGIGEIMHVAEAIRVELQRDITVVGREVSVGASVGVALDPADGADAETLLRNADAALYRAKERGRNRAELFDDVLRQSQFRRLDDERELRRAIDSGQIVPWYQPEVDLRTGLIVGAEVLARWLHPERGSLDASQFVPLAEETGLVDRLAQAVLEPAIAQRAAWQQGQLPDGFRIRVNVSPRTLTMADLPDRLSRLMDRHRCRPSGVSIEVTETALVADMDHAARQLEVIRALGVTVALDDFGTGYSSLSLLQRLPLDGVKIDRTFIRNLAHDPRDRALVAAVLTLARELELCVTAEGVEVMEQVALLQRLGCDRGQGFLWSPAVPADQLPSLVAAGAGPPRVPARP